MRRIRSRHRFLSDDPKPALTVIEPEFRDYRSCRCSAYATHSHKGARFGCCERCCRRGGVRASLAELHYGGI